MPGQIRHMIDAIICGARRENATIAMTTKTKLILKGINPDRYSAASDDDPSVTAKLRAIATELGVHV